MTNRMPLTPSLLAAAILLLPGCRDRDDGSTSHSPSVAAVSDASAPMEAATAVVIASVAGVQPGGEPVEVALQTEAQWGTSDAVYHARVPAEAAAVALRFDGVTPGEYAVVAIQPDLAPLRVGQEDQPAHSPEPLLTPAVKGGWAAAGATGRRRPEWSAARVAVPAQGRTVALSLTH